MPLVGAINAFMFQVSSKDSFIIPEHYPNASLFQSVSSREQTKDAPTHINKFKLVQTIVLACRFP
jgi:hypothetical protein